MYLSRISHSSGCAVIEFVVTLVSCSQGKVEGLEVVEGSHVKVKGYLMMKGRPAMCVKMSTAKPGKHGHVKCNIVGQDLLKPDKKYQHMVAISIAPSTRFVYRCLLCLLVSRTRSHRGPCRQEVRTRTL